MNTPNPLNSAIDALHSAFVGGPAEEAGQPVSFAEEAPTPSPYGEPESLLESAVEAVAFYSEDSPASIYQVHGRLQGLRKVAKRHVTAILAEAVQEGLLTLSNGEATLTDDGEVLAVERGWIEGINAAEEPPPFHSGGIIPEDEDESGTEDDITPYHAQVLLNTSAKALVTFAADHDSAADLRVLYRAEKDGKARKTVLEAFVKRGKALSGGSAAHPDHLEGDGITSVAVPTGQGLGERIGDPILVIRDEEVTVTVPAKAGDAEKALTAPPVVVPEEPEEAPSFQGIEITPDLPDLSSLSPVEKYLLRRVQELTETITALTVATVGQPRKKAPSAPRTVPEGRVAIGALAPGTWIRLPAGKLALTVSPAGVKFHRSIRLEEDGSWKKDSRRSTRTVSPAEAPSAEVIESLPASARKYLP